jgi:molybdenum cofactor cytidylyltransferase
MEKTVAILLAAGASRRMGRPKQLLDWRGQPLVRHVGRQILGCPEVESLIVVTGAHAEAVTEALDGLSLLTVPNRDYASGLSASLHRGLDKAAALSAIRALVCLADQPSVTTEHLSALLQLRNGHEIVATAYPSGRLGVPACFPRSSWPFIRKEGGDAGAKFILQSGAYPVHSLKPDFPLFDIDTPEDYARHAGDR